MSPRNTEKNPDGPTLVDLINLHRYARARARGGKLSSGNFVADRGKSADGTQLSEDKFKSGVDRLNDFLDLNVMVKRPISVKTEIGGDMLYPEDFDKYRIDPRPETSSPPDAVTGDKLSNEAAPISWTNKPRLTLDGEIAGELASIVAGYVALTKAATKRISTNHKTNPKRAKLRSVASNPDDRPSRYPVSDRERFLMFLKAERRRLHSIVTPACSDPSYLFDLTNAPLPEHVDYPDAADTTEMDSPKSNKNRK